jgi:hypothetical protein
VQGSVLPALPRSQPELAQGAVPAEAAEALSPQQEPEPLVAALALRLARSRSPGPAGAQRLRAQESSV